MLKPRLADLIAPLPHVLGRQIIQMIIAERQREGVADERLQRPRHRNRLDRGQGLEGCLHPVERRLVPGSDNVQRLIEQQKSK